MAKLNVQRLANNNSAVQVLKILTRDPPHANKSGSEPKRGGGVDRQEKFMIETFYHLFKSNHTLANSITNATSHSILNFTRRNNAPTKGRSSKILLLPSRVLLPTTSKTVIPLKHLLCRNSTGCTKAGTPKSHTSYLV